MILFKIMEMESQFFKTYEKLVETLEKTHHIARVPTRDLAARKKETYHWNPCHSEIPDFTSVLFPLVASNFTMTLDVLQIQTAFSIYCYVDISKSPQFGGIMKKKAEFYNNKYQIRPTIIFIKSKQRGKK